MLRQKTLGQYCKFVKQYVPATYRYFPDGTKEIECGKNTCGNTHCALSQNFKGDRAEGQDYLEK